MNYINLEESVILLLNQIKFLLPALTRSATCVNITDSSFEPSFPHRKASISTTRPSVRLCIPEYLMHFPYLIASKNYLFKLY